MEAVMRGKNFIICGLAGWCIEVAFTSLSSIKSKDKRLIGRTSAWMFPIYGMASCIEMIYPKIKHWHTIQRGFLYGASIMTGEFLSGSLLTKLDACPWNYDDCKYSIKGLIRLDFFPLWMLTGLFFEWLLLQNLDFAAKKEHTLHRFLK